MKKEIRNYCLSSTLMLCLAGNASAAFTLADGDMILGFRAGGNTGFQTDLHFNLGSTVSIRDGVGFGLKGNINDDLVATYGANWFTRTDLTFGAIGNRSSLSPTVVADFTPGQPDPSRILYLTRATSVPGAAAAHPTITGNAIGTVANNVSTLEGILGLRTETSFLDGAATFSRSDNQTQYDASSWAARTPPTGTNFGGVQNITTAFGQGGTEVYLDIQRLGGSSSTVGYTNTYEGTIAIDNLGNISVIPEPSTLTLAGIAALALVTRRRR